MDDPEKCAGSCSDSECDANMGNTRSSHFQGDSEDSWWSSTENTFDTSSRSSQEQEQERREERQARLEESKTKVAELSERRRHIVEEKSKEIDRLRVEIQQLKAENEKLRNSKADKEFRNDCDTSLQIDTSSISTQTSENSSVDEDNVDLNKIQDLEKERVEYKSLVMAQKEVILVYKHMLKIKEMQLQELNAKLGEIEKIIAKERMQQDLRREYERQLINIRSLKTLYEEKARAEKREKEELLSYLDTVKKELEMEQNRNKELEGRISDLEETDSKKYDDIKHLESDLGLARAESRQYASELTIINQLFSDVLLGYNSSQDVNLDKLQKYLEENHDFLQGIANNEEVTQDLSSMPKTLLELLNQIEENQKIKEKEDNEVAEDKQDVDEATDTTEQTSETSPQMNSPQEIVKNLPKVWRILIELLSHQTPPVNDLNDTDQSTNPCYKTVETPKGPSLVLSVSQTFIRLKNLILEKKSLEKETNKLKQLNCHLENRLQEQEKRLELVQSEVSKTWHVVGKIQKQHQLIQTQEKVLRYELAQKRKLLVELREELECSRAKWAQAREKNSSTEQQWKQLRSEFASRKTRVKVNFDDSAESGFSDENERECSSDSSDEQACDTAD